jgi:hypothetical protein
MEREDGREEEANARANAKWNGEHGDEVKAGGKEKIIAVMKVGTEGKGGGGEGRERRCSGGDARERGRECGN